MKTNIKSWALASIIRRQHKINPKPQYQRGAVWSESKKQLLIDTILREYDIPKLYLRNSTDDNYEHEVVDGQQRLRAIWEFAASDFPLGSKSNDLSQGDLSGTYYDDLSSDAQDHFNEYQLSVVFIENASDLEIRDLFLRLQEGETLNPAEKRNAMPGNMRDFIAEQASHKVFSKVNHKDKRFTYDDWLAHVTCIELAGGATDVKANNLKKMYEDNKLFNKNGHEAKKVIKNLNYLAKVLDNEPAEMDIKWGFVDLYLLISSLEKNYVLKNREEDFADVFIGFESERRAVDDPADLLSDTRDEWDKDLYDYIQAFTTSGAIRKNIEIRHKVYKNRFLRDVPIIEQKDSKRLFSHDQKIVIWRRDNGECKICGNTVPFKEMHADHITPHSKGGKTTVENGQTLCKQCNLKKSSKKKKYKKRK